jgi:hypothetical protein
VFLASALDSSSEEHRYYHPQVLPQLPEFFSCSFEAMISPPCLHFFILFLCFLPWQRVGTTTKKKEKEKKRRKRKEKERKVVIVNKEEEGEGEKKKKKKRKGKEGGDSKNVELHDTMAVNSKFFCTFLKLARCSGSGGLQGSKEAWDNGVLGGSFWGLFFFHSFFKPKA